MVLDGSVLLERECVASIFGVARGPEKADQTEWTLWTPTLDPLSNLFHHGITFLKNAVFHLVLNHCLFGTSVMRLLSLNELWTNFLSDQQ